MRFIKLILIAAILLAIAGAAAGWFLAGREAGPSISIGSPQKYVGRSTPLNVTVESHTPVTAPEVTIEQGGQAMAVTPEKTDWTGTGRVAVSGTIGKSSHPALANGPARLIVTARRSVFFGMRHTSSTVTQDVEVRLDPPRVAVISLHHFINAGGAEFVVMRATPPDVEAGIRVGDARYPMYPGAAVGIADPALRVGFFAWRHDQDAKTRLSAYARDSAGNEVTAPFDFKPFPKRFLDSRIPIDQRFLDRVVPAIASNTPDLKVDTSSPDGLLKGFLEINGNLRKKNNDTIAALAAKTQPKMLWSEAFAPMGNAQVESRFADRRTYFFEDREIDRQVHLGFDLASLQQAAVQASNAGVVVHADYLGIYGNCVIIDHGLGVQSLYAHLSTMTVKAGDTVTKGQELGRTGSTGLAGGDHLHFTVLLQGTPVNPVEWWDGHWMEDRVFRKIREAGGQAPSPKPQAATSPKP
jgi:murein DD-endopeptidase MepM/ murein hydrolase activator NlpD